MRRRALLYTSGKNPGYITVNPTPNTLTYNGTAQELVSAGSGSGTILYSIDNLNFYSDIPTSTDAGNYTVYYKAAESGRFFETEVYSVSCTISKAAGYVSTTPVNTAYAYNGTARALASAGVGTGTMYYRIGTSGDFTTSIPTASAPGSWTLYYYAAASTNYNLSSTGNITVTQVKASLSAPTATGATVTYGSTATASASGGGGQGSIEWSNGNTRTAVGSLNTLARWSGNNYYNASAWSSAVTLTVNKAAGSVTKAPTNTGYAYNGTARALANAGSGTGTMYYRLGTSGSFSTSIPTASAPGSWTLYYYAAASTNYNQSGTGSITVTLVKANQNAPTATGATVTYGSTATATASGGGGLGSIGWSNGNTRTAVGSQSTQARWTGNTYYNASAWSNSVTLTVNKAAGSVTTKPTAKSLTYTGSAQALVNAGSGTGTMYYSLSSSSGFSTSIPTGTNGGTYTVYYYAAASTNYNLSATGSVSVTIGKKSSAISITNTYNQAYCEKGYTFQLEYSRTAGDGTISWSSSNTSIATVSSSGVVTGVGLGDVTITVTTSATSGYNAASATYSLSVVNYQMSGIATILQFNQGNMGSKNITLSRRTYNYTDYVLAARNDTFKPFGDRTSKMYIKVISDPNSIIYKNAFPMQLDVWNTSLWGEACCYITGQANTFNSTRNGTAIIQVVHPNTTVGIGSPITITLTN